MKRITDLQELFETALKSQSFAGTPTELYEPFGYMLGLGGKRLRPVLLLHTCELFCGDALLAMPQAMAIELFHNFTLIHDDIMDHAPLRRGLPTVHEKFNHATAILSGDAMLVMAYKFLVQADASRLPVLLELFNDTAVKVCEGQQYDMNFENAAGLTVADYLRMIELKTAVLVASALKLGAIIGGAGSEDAQHLYEFGRELGISFQLRDDWLDSFGSAKQVGKQQGGDILQNKRTFLLIEAMEQGDTKLRSELQYWYSSKEFKAEEKITAVIGLFNQAGISERTLEETALHFHRAMFHLDELNIPEERKATLKSFSESLLYREK